MKVFLGPSLFFYLSQFSVSPHPSVFYHPSLTLPRPGVGIKWSILLSFLRHLSQHNFFGLSNRTLSGSLQALTDTCRTLSIWLISLGLDGKTTVPHISFRFLSSRYLYKHSPSFPMSLVTDVSLFIGQLWHGRSCIFSFMCWQLTREYFLLWLNSDFFLYMILHMVLLLPPVKCYYDSIFGVLHNMNTSQDLRLLLIIYM